METFDISNCMQTQSDGSVGATDDPLTILNALTDDDSAFIDFKGVSAADFSRSLAAPTPGIVTAGLIRIQINGTDYWLQYYTSV